MILIPPNEYIATYVIEWDEIVVIKRMAMIPIVHMERGGKEYDWTDTMHQLRNTHAIELDRWYE